MPDTQQHVLVFCLENQIIADQIARDFAQGGLLLEKMGLLDTNGQKTLQQVVGEPTVAILLLVTDNFLKSSGCMYGALEAAKSWSESGKIILIVTQGRRRIPNGGWEDIPTSFFRGSGIIQYMNYWQDQYLDLRKEKRSREDDPVLDQEIEIIKAISGTVGEILFFFRNLSWHTLEDFKANHYKVFRDFTGITTLLGGEDQPSDKTMNPPAPPTLKEAPRKRTLAEIIQDSKAELLAENPDLETSPEEVPPALVRSSAANPEEKDSATQEDSAQSSENDDANNLEDLLNEVLQEGDDAADPIFLGDDPDHPEAFDFDSLFEEEDLAPASRERDAQEDFNEEEEILLDLIADDEEGLVLNADGVSHSTPEDVLDAAIHLFENHQNEQGFRYLRKTIELNPGDNRLRYYLAYAFAQYEHDFSAAVQELEDILARDRNFADAWFLLGEISESEGDFLEARHYYEKVLELEPAYENACFRLGLLCLQHFAGQQAKAAAYFKQTVELNKKNTDAHYLLAILLNEHLDDPQKAIRHFKKTLKYQPDHPFANYDLALLYHKLGERALASHYYELAARINPELKTPRNDEAFRFAPESEPSPAQASAEEPEGEGQPGELPPAGEAMGEPSPEGDKIEVEAQEEETVPLKIFRSISLQPLEESAAETPEAPAALEEAAKEEQPLPPVVQLKTVFISGATSGIGKATAEIFAKNGYQVIATGRRQERLEEMKQDFKARFDNEILTLNFDVRNLEAIHAALENLPEEWKNIDILINNAGLSRGLDPIHEGRIEDWEAMIDTNLKGLLYLTRAISPHLVQRRSGHIINVASSAGKEVYPGGNVYCATKFAVDALTKAMRLDLYKYNIRVSQVAPGHVEETEFARVRFDGDEQKAAKVYEDFQPLKSSDVAEVIYFIATRPSHVNIQDVFMFSTQQAGSNFIDRSGR